MTSEKSFIFQCLKKEWLGLVLALGLMGGCADALDQTNGDLDSKANGMVLIADQMHAQGDDEGAMQFYARALQRTPNDPLPRRKLAELFESHGGNADAAEQYRALLKFDPDNADYHRAYGRVLIKLGKPSDAKEQYEAALSSDPNDVRALNGLGVALDLLGDHAGAQARYNTALEQKPDDPATLSNLGHSYVLAGAYGDAIKLLEPHVQDPGTPAVLRQNLAEAYGMSGMDVDAARILRIDLPPEAVDKNLARYRDARAKTSSAYLYADLGSFTTPAFAKTRLDKIKEQFSAGIGGLTLDVVPEVKVEGGTPIFHARANGFKNIAEAKAFCETLKKGDAFCKAYGK